MSETCIALDDQGQRCRRRATRIEQYHGANDLYGYFNPPWPSWVRAALCDKHCPHTKIESSLSRRKRS